MSRPCLVCVVYLYWNYGYSDGCCSVKVSFSEFGELACSGSLAFGKDADVVLIDQTFLGLGDEALKVVVIAHFYDF